MIAIDTSSLQRLLAGETGDDCDQARTALDSGEAALPPVVLTEVLCQPGIDARVIADLESIPLLEIAPGYWQRAGLLRARLLAGGFKANVADTLIAQACIDQIVPLITHDRDFRHFVKAGLKLL